MVPKAVRRLYALQQAPKGGPAVPCYGKRCKIYKSYCINDDNIKGPGILKDIKNSN